MTNLDLFRAIVAPSIFISAAGLLILSVNGRLMAIVTRLRAFHREKHKAVIENKKLEIVAIQSQIEAMEIRAGKIKNAYMYLLFGIAGTMITCLILGLSIHVGGALLVAVISFVLSVLSMLVGTYFYISEIALSLGAVKEEEKIYELIDCTAMEASEGRDICLQ